MIFTGTPCGTCNHIWQKTECAVGTLEFCTICYLMRYKPARGDWEYRAPLPFPNVFMEVKPDA